MDLSWAVHVLLSGIGATSWIWQDPSRDLTAIFVILYWDCRCEVCFTRTNGIHYCNQMGKLIQQFSNSAGYYFYGCFWESDLGQSRIKWSGLSLNQFIYSYVRLYTCYILCNKLYCIRVQRRFTREVARIEILATSWGGEVGVVTLETPSQGLSVVHSIIKTKSLVQSPLLGRSSSWMVFRLQYLLPNS